MIPPTCKRLIEVDFPIAKVSEHSAREKSIRHGHPSTLHLWWARRPLAACRAVLLGLLLPAPTERDCPADFKSKARELLQKRHRKPLATDQELQDDLLAFIGEFADWDNASNALYLEIGRGLVKAAHPEETPVVVDPFAGGGSIPLEALRLGCEAFASDLNPVACLILKTLLEDIPRYGNAEFRFKKPPMDTNKHESEKGKTIGVHSPACALHADRCSFVVKEEGDEVVIHGLANALRYVGQQVKEAAEKELAQFYPPDPDGSRPIAYLWARTVRCEAVGCGAEIPLVRSFWLSKKAGRKRALRYHVHRNSGKPPHLIFEVFEPKNEDDIPAGTVARANATCPCCHTVLPAARVRAQLTAQRGGADVQFDSKENRIGGAMLLAIVALRDSSAGRLYRLPTPQDYAVVCAAQKALAKCPKDFVPDEPIHQDNRGNFWVVSYGPTSFADLFSARQKLALVILCEAIRKLWTNEGTRGLAELLSLAISRYADGNAAISTWLASYEKIQHVFSRQALPMVWDYAEANPFSGSTKGLDSALDFLGDFVSAQEPLRGACGSAQQSDAAEHSLPDAASSVWFTDPPYYDSVAYSGLSDFFFVWLKRMLPKHPLLRNPFDSDSPVTPKGRELIVDTRDLNGGVHTPDFYERGMATAFAEGRRVLKTDGIGCVVFAHKTTEGWEALLSGLNRSRWTVTASWPLVTEAANRLRAFDSAALATSIHLVCRPRPADAGIGDWSEVKSAMEKRIREWLPTLVKHGVRGADAIFSCLGPALESYSRYDKVLTAADREVPLGGNPDATEPHERGFLAYVFEAVSKEALRQVLGDLPAAPACAGHADRPSGSAAQAGADTEGFEEDARLTALFLWTLQTTKTNGNGGKGEGAGKAEGKREKGETEMAEDEEDEEMPKKKVKAGYAMPFDTFIRITRPMGIHYPALEGRVLEIEKGIVRLLPVRERSEQLLGEAATRPGIQISLEDVQQMELGLLVKRQEDSAMLAKSKRGQKGKTAPPGQAQTEDAFTTLDRIHRAMLLFSLGRSTLLRQVLETEMRQGNRFERLALALNALYPDGSDERRMLEGVQSAMRGVK
ncbi:MAG: DUF1156 domain-containing protein [Verrucomicrobia bacterium]|nr:DUF1156 domain-containing protein [Verrucomicrobiota bacterium]